MPLHLFGAIIKHIRITNRGTNVIIIYLSFSSLKLHWSWCKKFVGGSGNHERNWPGTGSFYESLDSGGECGVLSETYFNMPTTNKDKNWCKFISSFLISHKLYYVTWHHQCVCALVANQITIFYYDMKLLTICRDWMKLIIYTNTKVATLVFLQSKISIYWFSCVFVYKLSYSVIYGMFHFCEL